MSIKIRDYPVPAVDVVHIFRYLDWTVQLDFFAHVAKYFL